MSHCSWKTASFFFLCLPDFFFLLFSFILSFLFQSIHLRLLSAGWSRLRISSCMAETSYPLIPSGFGKWILIQNIQAIQIFCLNHCNYLNVHLRSCTFTCADITFFLKGFCLSYLLCLFFSSLFMMVSSLSFLHGLIQRS